MMHELVQEVCLVRGVGLDRGQISVAPSEVTSQSLWPQMAVKIMDREVSFLLLLHYSQA